MADITNFQSLFQLGVALNIGLSYFEQIRKPFEEGLVEDLNILQEDFNDYIGDFEIIKKRVEEVALDEATNAGDPTSFSDRLSKEIHTPAQYSFEKSVDEWAIISQAGEDLIGMTKEWKNHDLLINNLSIGLVIPSLIGLFFTSFFVNQKELYVIFIIELFSIIIYFPLFFSLFLGIYARIRLRNISRQVQKWRHMNIMLSHNRITLKNKLKIFLREKGVLS